MKIGVITTSRADFSIYLSLLKNIPKESLLLFVTGMHLEAGFGKTIDAIIQEGFIPIPTERTLYKTCLPRGTAESMGEYFN